MQWSETRLMIMMTMVTVDCSGLSPTVYYNREILLSTSGSSRCSTRFCDGCSPVSLAVTDFPGNMNLAAILYEGDNTLAREYQ